jgi:hypothetical protein
VILLVLFWRAMKLWRRIASFVAPIRRSTQSERVVAAVNVVELRWENVDAARHLHGRDGQTAVCA